LGSLTMPKYRFRELRQAGGNVQWYHQMRWYSWPRYNNRTHRELTVIDGRVAFLGGAGFSDHWIYGKSSQPRWRDTMFRVRGDSVASLQGTFVENWVQSAHELLTGKDYFPFETSSGKTLAMVVNSSPSMIHCKILIVDGLWSVVGSTNFDSRSFGLNDEVNLTALDPALAETLQRQFADDLEHSRAVSYDEWSRRSYFQRAQEYLGWL